ncbi:hypothetical protein SVAN01_11248, partial [Stagonosporopsis vannaccii]
PRSHAVPAGREGVRACWADSSAGCSLGCRRGQTGQAVQAVLAVLAGRGLTEGELFSCRSMRFSALGGPRHARSPTNARRGAPKIEPADAPTLLAFSAQHQNVSSGAVNAGRAGSVSCKWHGGSSPARGPSLMSAQGLVERDSTSTAPLPAPSAGCSTQQPTPPVASRSTLQQSCPSSPLAVPPAHATCPILEAVHCCPPFTHVNAVHAFPEVTTATLEALCHLITSLRRAGPGQPAVSIRRSQFMV